MNLVTSHGSLGFEETRSFFEDSIRLGDEMVGLPSASLGRVGVKVRPFVGLVWFYHHQKQVPVAHTVQRGYYEKFERLFRPAAVFGRSGAVWHIVRLLAFRFATRGDLERGALDGVPSGKPYADFVI